LIDYLDIKKLQIKKLDIRLEGQTKNRDESIEKLK
jgi:hypothetical protein